MTGSSELSAHHRREYSCGKPALTLLRNFANMRRNHVLSGRHEDCSRSIIGLLAPSCRVHHGRRRNERLRRP